MVTGRGPTATDAELARCIALQERVSLWHGDITTRAANEKGQPDDRLACKFMVAGAGFEPTTFGL